MSDEERIAYWKDCYDRMAARNTDLAGLANDLLVALEAIHSHIDHPAHYNSHINEICEAAIAKAGGKS